MRQLQAMECSTLADLSSWGFENLGLSQCQMVTCFLQPNIQFQPYDRISKIQRIKMSLLGLTLCMLSMWLSYYSFPFSSLKHSCYWRIPQPWLCYNTTSKFDIFCFVSRFHNIVTPTNLCMLLKIACQWRICLINETDLGDLPLPLHAFTRHSKICTQHLLKCAISGAALKNA